MKWHLELKYKDGRKLSYSFVHIENAKQALHDYRKDGADGFIVRLDD